MITAAMRALPVGIPKVMVSTMASGNVAAYVGACDITMVYSVTDLAGLNRISRRVLGNAAHALAGMMLHSIPQTRSRSPGPGAHHVRRDYALRSADRQAAYPSLRLPGVSCHRHRRTVDGKAAGGQAHSSGVLDITTTEVCDHLFGGVLACTDDRFGAVARSQAPYVGSCGALDMVNFGAPGDAAATLSRPQVVSS